jgi:hypothetical protein
MNRDEAREAARALARAERAKLEHTCSLCATAAAGSAKSIPISHGRDRTRAPVARPAHHALTATAPRTSRRGYRKASNLMLKGTAPRQGAFAGWGLWQGPCRPAMRTDPMNLPPANRIVTRKIRNPPGQ